MVIGGPPIFGHILTLRYLPPTEPRFFGPETKIITLLKLHLLIALKPATTTIVHGIGRGKHFPLSFLVPRLLLKKAGAYRRGSDDDPGFLEDAANIDCVHINK